MTDTAQFHNPVWRDGHEDYFSQRLDVARLKRDADYAAGADYAAEDDAEYQEDQALADHYEPD